MDTRVFRCEGKRNDLILHYQQVFDNVFERKESKCCGVLVKHRRKIKREQVTSLQMGRQLKTKYVNVVPGQLFCR